MRPVQIALSSLFILFSLIPRVAAAQFCADNNPCPSNQAPSIQIWVSQGSTSQQAVNLTIYASDDGTLSMSSWRLWYKGVEVTSWIGTTGVVDDPGSMHTSVSATGTFTLTAGEGDLISEICDTWGPPGCSADTVQVTYTAPPTPPVIATPVLTLAQASDYRLLDDCATCASGTTGYSTPAFFANGAPQSTTLRYSSELGKPSGYAEVDVKVTSSAIPSRIRIRLRKPNTSIYATLSNGATAAYVSGDTARIRMAVQFPADSLATGMYEREILVTAFYGPEYAPTDSTSAVLSAVRFFIQNENRSRYGRGWTVSGDERIHRQGDGSLVLADGDGHLAYFAIGACGGSPWTCAFTAPRGDFSTMIRKVKSGTDTVWVRTARNGTLTEWSNTGLLRSRTDRWGNTFAIERMVSDTLDPARIHRTKLETVVGAVTITKYTTFSYNGSTGRLTTITLPDSRQVTFTQSSGTFGELLSIRDPDNRTALSATYTDGRLVTIAGRNRAVSNLLYDGYGQLANVIGPSFLIDSGYTARDTTWFSSPRRQLMDGNQPTITAAGDTPARSDGTTLAIVSGRDTVLTFAHRSGLPAKVVRRSGTTQTDSTLFTYDDSTRLLWTAGKSNAGAEYTWSGARLTSMRDVATGNLTELFYTNYDQIDSLRVDGVRQLRNFFSGARLAPDSTRTDTANVTRFTYDARGRQLTVRDANGATVTTTYETTHANAASVVRSANGAATTTTTYGYDAAGRPQTTTDPLARVFTTARNALNRDSVSTGPLSTVTTFSYDDSLGVYTVTDPKGQTYRTTVNPQGWVVESRDPRQNRDSVWYDRLGRPTRTKNRRGDVIRTTYDAFDRVLTRTAVELGGSKDSTTFAYDPAKRWVAVANAESIDTFHVDLGGRATRAATVRNGTRFSFTYGYALGDLLDEVKVTRDGATGPVWTATTGVGYDAARRAFRMLDMAGKVTTLVHDRGGREVGDTLPTSTTPAARVRKAVTYSAVGQPVAETYSNVANGATLPLDRTYGAFDAADRIGTIARPTATSPITRAHEYDALGRLALFTDKQLQVVAWTPVYVEDPYGDCPGCLILVDSTPTYDEVTLASGSYAYDAVGNRAGAGVTVGTGNRLTAQGGWTIAYDSLGQMTSRTNGSETLTYKWNALGQLDTVVAPGYTVTYGYDGLGRRVRKTVNGVATRYLVEGDRVLAELDNSWGVAATYAYRPGVDRPLAMQRGGATYYYTQDAQGNVTGLLNAAGSVVQQYHYTPYGEAQAGYGTIVNPYQYKGREWDAEARLHYMRARYYDPQLGRFLSEDPLGLAGGINPTAFVGAEPVNRIDPSGLLCTYVRERWDDHKSGTHGFTPWRATACDLSDYGGGSFGYGQRPGFPTIPRDDDHGLSPRGRPDQPSIGRERTPGRRCSSLLAIALTSAALDATFVGGMYSSAAKIGRVAYKNRRAIVRMLQVGYNNSERGMRKMGNRMARAFGEAGSTAAGALEGAFDIGWIGESMIFEWDSALDLLPAIGTVRDFQKYYDCLNGE